MKDVVFSIWVEVADDVDLDELGEQMFDSIGNADDQPLVDTVMSYEVQEGTLI